MLAKKTNRQLTASLVTLAALHASLWVWPSIVSAQEISLATYPSTLQLRAQAPTEVKSSFTIQNKSEQTTKLTFVLKPFRSDVSMDGKVAYIEGHDPTILKKIQILENDKPVTSLEIGPKQSKNLGLKINIDAQEETQDQYFSIIFLTTPPQSQDESNNEATAKSTAQVGIAMNVLLAIGPKHLPQGYLEEFSTASFRSSGPVAFTVKVKNSGDHYFSPKGVILIKNVFGQTVGKIDLQNTNILARTSRTMTGIPYDDSAKNGSEQNTIIQNTNTVVWPEKFLLGVYKAELSLALSEEGPLYNQTLSFIALPTGIIVALIVAIIFITLVVFRVRKKLKES